MVNFKDFFDLLFDKRYSLKFRILNILSGDVLRNYLAVGVELPLDKIQDVCNKNAVYNDMKIEIIQLQTSKAIQGLNDICRM